MTDFLEAIVALMREQLEDARRAHAVLAAQGEVITALLRIVNGEAD